MKKKYNQLGSNLIEYVIPLAVIGVVVGGGIYVLTGGSIFKNFITRTTGGMYSDNSSKIVMGQDIGSLAMSTMSTGIYQNPDGKTYLVNKEGYTISIPQNFYEKYAEEIEKYLKKGKFDFKPPSLVGEETSGTAGVEVISSDPNDSLKLYGLLLQIAAKYTDDKEAKSYLSAISKQGKKLGNKEKKLENVKFTLDAYKQNHEKFKNNYIDAKAEYLKALDSFNNGNPDELTKKDLDKLYKPVKKWYNKYFKLKNEFEKRSKTLSDMAYELSDEIKGTIGLSFDSIVATLEEDPNIDQDTKDMVMPIGERIQYLKDSIEILAQTVQTYNSSFSQLEQEELIEQMGELETVDVQMEEGAGDETYDLADSLPDDENDNTQDEETETVGTTGE